MALEARISVAGVSHEPFKSNIQTLIRHNGHLAPYSVFLIHDPHNRFDANAIDVYMKGAHHCACLAVGFIPRQLNTSLLKIGLDKLDALLLTFNYLTTLNSSSVVGVSIEIEERNSRRVELCDRLTKIERRIISH